jgi:hypothetical protein
MHLRCLFNNGDKTEMAAFPVQKFDLYYTKHRPVTRLLAEREIVENSSLHLFQQIYEDHGWVREIVPSPQPVENGTRRCPTSEPVYTTPMLAYSTNYHLLGIATPCMAEELRIHAPDFSLEETLIQFCLSYGTNVESCFPSLTNVTENAKPPQMIVSKHSLVAENEHDRKQLAGRIVPVFLLPHLLTLFPEPFQRATNILEQCQALSGRLREKVPLHLLPRYVGEQLELLSTNIRHLFYLYQRGLSLDPLVKQHYEEIILALVENQRAEAKLAALDRSKLVAFSRKVIHIKKKRRF